MSLRKMQETRWVNQRVLLSLAVVMVFVLSSSRCLFAQEEYAVLRQAAESVAESVVQIETTGGKERVGDVYIAAGPTTGLVVSDDGLVMTSSYTVVHEPSTILIQGAEGRRIPAQIVARDHARNLVLLRADEPVGKPATSLLPKDQIRVGAWVVAVGRAFDPTQINTSVGIVSAVDRVWGRAIQTDAKISPNNYGGPLVDLNGNLVGLIAPLSPQSEEALAGFEWYDSGIGFVVPLTDIAERLPRLASGEDLFPGKLGITPQSSDSFTSPVVIASVGRVSPAGVAGLMAGDEVVEVNGRVIRRYPDLRHALGSCYAGEKVSVTVRRGSEELRVEAVLEKEIEAFQVSTIGILPAVTDASGVAVDLVLTGSAAERAGLAAGDLIVSINSSVISNLDELATALASFAPESEIQLGLVRGGANVETSLVLDELNADFIRLPEVRAVSGAANEVSELLELKLEQFPESCDVVRAKAAVADGTGGLVVWLGDPGKHDAPALLEQWGLIAARRNIVVIAPHSSQERAWAKEDIERIGLLVQRAIQDFGLDPRRVSVTGVNAGAQMASLVFVDSGRPVRGLGIVGGGLGGNVTLPENEPLRRLFIATWLKTDLADSEQVLTMKEALQKQGLPLSVVPSPEPNSPDTWDEMAQWTMSLHRH